jgi:hypothetical protein
MIDGEQTTKHAPGVSRHTGTGYRLDLAADLLDSP